MSSIDFAKVNILNVFDLLPLGIAVLNTEGILLYCNKKLAEITGFSAKEAVGLPCRHVLRTRLCVSGCHLGCRAFSNSGLVDPAKKEGVEVAIRIENIADTMTSLQGGQESDLLTLKHSKIPIRLTHFPVEDDKKNIIFFIDIVEDLHELKKVEMHLKQSMGSGSFVGRSLAIGHIIEMLPSIAVSDAPILITGETGSGKDLLAETLHQASYRSREPFVRIGVGHLSEQLLQEELFGVGSDIFATKQGRFQQAVGGTIYLTELVNMPKSIQVQLINFLDEGTIMPVTAKNTVPVNVRLIAATSQDPAILMQEGLLMPELFYRFNLGHLHLPPLRERHEDIDFLLQHFLTLFTTKLKKTITRFSTEVRNILFKHTYPGNVRELRNIVEYAVMVCSTHEITKQNLPTYLSINWVSGVPLATKEKTQPKKRTKRNASS